MSSNSNKKKSNRVRKEVETVEVPLTPSTMINSGSSTKHSFNDQFQTACGTPGAPKPPNAVPFKGSSGTVHTQLLPELILAFIAAVAAKGGLIVGDVGILTNHAIITALQGVNCSLTMDKCVITPYRMKLYNWLRCFVKRSVLPGNVIGHLSRRGLLRGQPVNVDILEPLRVVGVEKESHTRPENNTKSLSHRKFIVALLPNKKGELIPTSVLIGSANYTENMDNNSEVINHHENCPDLARIYYDIWAHSYSISEGLGIHDTSPVPDHEWQPAKLKKGAYVPHRCGSCGSDHTTIAWADDPFDTNPNPRLRKKSKVIWCPTCREIVRTI
jgi:hypothetical protein